MGKIILMSIFYSSDTLSCSKEKNKNKITPNFQHIGTYRYGSCAHPFCGFFEIPVNAIRDYERAQTEKMEIRGSRVFVNIKSQSPMNWSIIWTDLWFMGSC